MSYRVRLILCFAWVIGVCIASGSVSAAEVEFDVHLGADTRSISIGTSVEYFEDEAGSYSLDDVRELSLANRWVKSVKNVPNFGFSSSAYWFRFKLSNVANERFNGLLELGYPLLDQVDVYLLSATHEKKAMPDYLLGDFKRFSERVIPHRNFLVPLAMPPQQSMIVYIRVETGSATQLPIVVWEDQAFYQADADWLMLQGLFYGIMLIMALYNLFVFVAIRDVSYFYYVCYVVGFATVMASIQGLGFQYIWADSLKLQDYAPVYSIIFAILAVLAFTDRFLSLEDRSERLHKACVLLVMSLVAASFLAALLPYSLSIRVTLVLVIACAIFCMASGLIISSQGHKEAKYYTVAWSVLIVSIVVLALNKLGFVPRNIWTENMGQVGAAIEVTLLSLALADQMNRERNNKLLAQDEAIHHEREARRAHQQSVEVLKIAEDRLAEKVKERTVVLESALEDLSIANRKLKEMSSIDGLTGVRNRGYFDLMVLKEFQKCRESGNPIALLMLDIDHFKDLNDAHGHVYGDECLRAIASVINDTVKWPADGVARYGGEEFVVLLPETQMQGAKLLAEKIRSRVESQTWDIGGNELSSTISIGLASFEPVTDGDTPEKLLAKADQALYKAKDGGRNQVCEG